MYNRSLLEPDEQRTIDTWSLDNLLEFAARRQRDLGARGIRPMAVKRSFMAETMSYLSQFGASVINPATGRCGLNSPECLAAFEYDRELGRRMPAYPPGAQCGVGDLLEGRLAVWHGGSTIWSEVSDRSHIGLAPMPYGRQDAKRK